MWSGGRRDPDLQGMGRNWGRSQRQGGHEAARLAEQVLLLARPQTRPFPASAKPLPLWASAPRLREDPSHPPEAGGRLSQSWEDIEAPCTSTACSLQRPMLHVPGTAPHPRSLLRWEEISPSIPLP